MIVFENYFKLVSSGFNKDTEREEIEINCGDNGKLLLYKTDEGFVVDVYNQTEFVDSLAVWEDDLEPDVDELFDEDKVYYECEELYNKTGSSSVNEFVNKQLLNKNPLYKDVVYDHCTPCEAEQPFLNGVCLVCGTIK